MAYKFLVRIQAIVLLNLCTAVAMHWPSGSPQNYTLGRVFPLDLGLAVQSRCVIFASRLAHDECCREYPELNYSKRIDFALASSGGWHYHLLS